MPMPRVAASPGELLACMDGIAHVEADALVIDDAAALRAQGIRDVVWTATFSADQPTVEAARWIVWEASQLLGCPSASIHELYMARGRGEVGGFTVPALNLRTQVFDMASATARAAAELDAGTVIFELARSEQAYTHQPPGEFITSVLAGCITAGWDGPVFIQGDHFQFDAQRYRTDPDGVTQALRAATVTALEAGYGNIDIDSSTLVDLSFPSVAEQQRTNHDSAAELAALIRAEQDDGLTVSIGGEIGEVGMQDSTEEELRAYLEGFRRGLDARVGADAIGLSKVSVQTGTSHGGVPLPGGGVADVRLDFGALERLSAVCRSYGLAGAVQHGASTLPDELFHRFPRVETAEIHLATGFQNLLLDHPAFPADLRAAMDAWCIANAAHERKDGETDGQFIYRTRKQALGEHKRRLWELEEKDEIIAAQEEKLRFLFEQLSTTGTKTLVRRFVRAPRRSRPAPDSLREVTSSA